jgi:valyl-tRNA synthetase
MHPKDPRYKQYSHGEKIEVEWINGKITATIIKDESIDMDFGTGVMTITPWHSEIDFEIANRHNLDKEQVIDRYGKLLPISGEFSGMKIEEAREKIVEKLAKKGLVEKIEDYTHNKAVSERTGAVIEPQIMKQWFVAVDKDFVMPHSTIEGIKSGEKMTLKQMMRKCVESGEVELPQEGFRNSYFHWIDNLHDWCISRQIWFGHRIPVWYKDEKIYCDTKAPQDDGWIQDEDVLDTWFSSALWTFSTLGWPENTQDLKKFHPTSFMSPGYEILNLWVSRMILMSGFHLGQIPFKKVLIHGLVRAKDGRKFSKSLNNGVDPLDMIKKYGADALRMGLLVGSAIGSDIKFDEQKIKGYKHFANKLWNITRFILENNPELFCDKDKALEKHSDTVTEWQKMLEDITNDMNEYRLYMASEKLYSYSWHTFADKIIEKSKEDLKDESKNESTKNLLGFLLIQQIKALHPFMPFVTETIWQLLPEKATYPVLQWW